MYKRQVEQGLIDWKTAVRRIPADQVDQLLTPIFDREAIKRAKVLTRGLPAGPGAATGRIYLNAERCVEAADRGEKAVSYTHLPPPMPTSVLTWTWARSSRRRRKLPKWRLKTTCT